LLQASERSDDALYRAVTWRFLPFLMVCYAVAYLDRVNIGIAKLGMSHDLALSDAVYGAGAGIFFVGYFLCEVPSNAMLHKLGARVWIARIMMSWAVASAACAFVQGPVSFYCARFLLGVTEAGFFPGIILYLTYWYPAARRGRIVAFFMTAIPIAGLVGTPLSGVIMTFLDGALGWSGWRWMLVCEALPAFVLGASVPFILDSRVEHATWLTDGEKARLSANLAMDAPSSGHAHPKFRDVVSDPLILRFSILYFCCVMGQYGITFWLPTLLGRVGHGSAWLVGLYATLPYGCAVLAMLWVGRHSDLTGERKWHLILPLVVGALALGVAPLANGNVPLSVMILSLAAAAVLTATPLFWNLPTAVLSGTSAAIGIAAINSVGNIAGFVSPMVVGWLSERSGSIGAGMWMLTAVMIGGALIAQRIKTPPSSSRSPSIHN
jgi:MFS family permease